MFSSKIMRNLVLLSILYLVFLVDCQKGIYKKKNTTPDVSENIQNSMINEEISRMPLEERGMNRAERIYYTETAYAKRYPNWMKEIFINKEDASFGLIGLHKDLITCMYGKPNKTEDDTAWYYIDKSYQNLLKLKFNDEHYVIENQFFTK